jgi:hypothetical protein
VETSLVIFQVAHGGKANLLLAFGALEWLDAFMLVDVVVKAGLVEVELIASLFGTRVSLGCSIVLLFQMLLKAEVSRIDLGAYAAGELLIGVLIDVTLLGVESLVVLPMLDSPFGQDALLRESLREGMSFFHSLVAFQLDVHLWEAGIHFDEGGLFVFSLDLPLLLFNGFGHRLLGLLNHLVVSHF